MKPVLLLLAGLATTASATADQARTRFDLPGMPRLGWFICDGVDAPLVALVAKKGISRALSVALLRKDGPAAPRVLRYTLGEPEPGAGQLHWPLSEDGHVVGNLHAFTPGAYGDAGTVRTPPFTSMALGATQFQCRWLANTHFIGVTARRTVVVREETPGKLVYESFDFAATVPLETPDGARRTTAPSQRVPAGWQERTGTGARYRFENAGYGYVVSISPAGPARLSVVQGGRTVLDEPVLAYTLAR